VFASSAGCQVSANEDQVSLKSAAPVDVWQSLQAADCYRMDDFGKPLFKAREVDLEA
jgi:hypothetical protein